MDSTKEIITSKYPFIMKVFELHEDNGLRLIGYCGAERNPREAKAEYLNAINEG